MARPCFTSERRAQSVGSARETSQVEGFRRLAPFCPACQSRGSLRRPRPAALFRIAGPARPPGNRAVTRRRGGAAASLAREARCVSSARCLWQIGRRGAPQAHDLGRLRSRHCGLGRWPKTQDASREPQTGLRTALVRFLAQAQPGARFSICVGFAAAKNTRYTSRLSCSLRCRISHRSLHRLPRQLEQFCYRCHRLR